MSEPFIVKEGLGVNTADPVVSIDFNTADGMKVPTGNTDQRPTANSSTVGVIRFNEEESKLEIVANSSVIDSLVTETQQLKVYNSSNTQIFP